MKLRNCFLGAIKAWLEWPDVLDARPGCARNNHAPRSTSDFRLISSCYASSAFCVSSLSSTLSLGQSVAPPRPPPPTRRRRSTSTRELLCLIRSMPLYGSRINGIFGQVGQGCRLPAYGTHNARFRVAGVVGGAPPNRPRRVRLGTASGSQCESLETQVRAPLPYP